MVTRSGAVQRGFASGQAGQRWAAPQPERNISRRNGSDRSTRQADHGHLLDGVTEPVLQRAFPYWRNVDKNLGDKIESGVRAKQR